MLTNTQLIAQQKAQLQQLINHLRGNTQPTTDLTLFKKIDSVAYDSDQKLNLANLVEQLIADIDSSFYKQGRWRSAGEHESFKVQYAAYAARVLNQVIHTIQEPSKANCNKLQTIASQAKGNSTWVKVGMVLSMIAGTLLGLFPGLIFACIYGENNTWEKRTQRQSLASSAKAILPITRSFSRFFQESAPIVAKEQLAANDNAMLPPAYEENAKPFIS